MPHEPWHRGLPGFEGGMPEDAEPVGNVLPEGAFGTADPTAAFDPEREFGFDLLDAENPESSVFPESSQDLRAGGENLQDRVESTPGGTFGVQATVGLILVGLALWLLQPVLEIVANLTEPEAGG